MANCAVRGYLRILRSLSLPATMASSKTEGFCYMMSSDGLIELSATICLAYLKRVLEKQEKINKKNQLF
jgi:hypothetical protein